MRTANLFDIGECVMIRATVVSRSFDDRGSIRYKLKDEKTGKIFDWQYLEKEMIPIIEEQSSEEEENSEEEQDSKEEENSEKEEEK